MAEEQPNNPPAAPQPYAPSQYGQPGQYPQGQFTPQGVPVRKGRGGSSALVWILGGCGVFALICIVGLAFFVKSIGNTFGKSELMQNKAALPTMQGDLREIRSALNKYVGEHQGKYPSSLDKIVDPSYLSTSSSTGQVTHVEYTPPKPDAPPDSTVATFYAGKITTNLMGQSITQKTYLCLLKDQSIVQEQTTRVPMPGQ